MQTNIPNRYGTESLTVSTMSETSGGPCISISAMAGQLSFYHFMTPEQARQMASALTTAAQCIEVQAKLTGAPF